MTPLARLVAVVLVGFVPWVVVLGRGPGASASLVFSFGLVNPAPFHVTPIWTYLLVLTRGLPESLLAWPVASLLYATGLGSAVIGRLAGLEDERLTGGLLVLAGVSLLPVSAAVGRPASVVSIPVGVVALWLVAWWGYRGALTRIVAGGDARER